MIARFIVNIFMEFLEDGLNVCVTLWIFMNAHPYIRMFSFFRLISMHFIKNQNYNDFTSWKFQIIHGVYLLLCQLPFSVGNSYPFHNSSVCFEEEEKVK